MEQKELLKSHQELVRLKMAQLNAIQAEVQATVNLIAVELGIDPMKEQWNLSPDGAFFEKVEPPEKK